MNTPRPELSFDGCGINGPDEHRTRLFTAPRDKWDSPEIRKYAPLFVAAPDMLEALKEAENCLRWAAQESVGRVDKEKVGGWLHHADKVRAVIAKAEGSP